MPFPLPMTASASHPAPRPASVSDIPDLNLCTSCGVCAGVCPVQAITMQVIPGGIWSPVIDRTCARIADCAATVVPDRASTSRKCSSTSSGTGLAPSEIGNYVDILAGQSTDPGLAPGLGCSRLWPPVSSRVPNREGQCRGHAATHPAGPETPGVGSDAAKILRLPTPAGSDFACAAEIPHFI
jgi:ferredoxin